MSGRFFCMYCGTANFPSPYTTHFECKQCSQLIEIPNNQSTNRSVVSSPSTPSCASTISSRCSSAVESELSPSLPDLHLESSNESDEESIKPSTGTIKKRRRSSGKKRDPRQPKRAANAYMLFCKHERPLLRAKRPDLPFAIIGQTLGDMWRQMSIEQRKPYELRAAKERERYKLEMHAFTSQTLRQNSVIEPLINQTLSQFNFPSLNNQSINQSSINQSLINQSINQTDLFHALNQSNNRSINPSMMDFQQSINRTIKQQSIPLMVQQAQQSYIQSRYHPYNRPFKQPINQSLNGEQFINQSINQSNNQFVYGPIKRERRFSYQSINSINQFVNQSNNHGLISTDTPNNQSINQSNNQSINTQNPFVFENFSSLEPPSINQSSNQSITQFDFPNDCLDLESANFGLWEPAFDEI